MSHFFAEAYIKYSWKKHKKCLRYLSELKVQVLSSVRLVEQTVPCMEEYA